MCKVLGEGRCQDGNCRIGIGPEVERFRFYPFLNIFEAALPGLYVSLSDFFPFLTSPISPDLGEPVGNVKVSLNLLENVKLGKKKNFARAFGSTNRTSDDGMATLRSASPSPYSPLLFPVFPLTRTSLNLPLITPRLIAGTAYVISATADGYHK